MKNWIILGMAVLLTVPHLSSQDKAEFPFERRKNNVYFNLIGGDGSVIST